MRCFLSEENEISKVALLYIVLHFVQGVVEGTVIKICLARDTKEVAPCLSADTHLVPKTMNLIFSFGDLFCVFVSLVPAFAPLFSPLSFGISKRH